MDRRVYEGSFCVSPDTVTVEVRPTSARRSGVCDVTPDLLPSRLLVDGDGLVHGTGSVLSLHWGHAVEDRESRRETVRGIRDPTQTEWLDRLQHPPLPRSVVLPRPLPPERTTRHFVELRREHDPVGPGSEGVVDVPPRRVLSVTVTPTPSPTSISSSGATLLGHLRDRKMEGGHWGWGFSDCRETGDRFPYTNTFVVEGSLIFFFGKGGSSESGLSESRPVGRVACWSCSHVPPRRDYGTHSRTPKHEVWVRSGSGSHDRSHPCLRLDRGEPHIRNYIFDIRHLPRSSDWSTTFHEND